MSAYSSHAPSAAAGLGCVERWYCFDSIASTNTFALELAEGPSADQLFVVTARRQRRGRGQRGNTFLSDTDTGLWVSVVVQLADIGEHFAVNRALALAACRAAGDSAEVDARIKWPNDIVVGERKLAGVLLESVSGAPGRVVAGLGMNVNTAREEFPVEIRPIATSLAAETGRTFAVTALLSGVLTAFDELRRTDGRHVHEWYRERLCGVGRAVRIGEYAGVFGGVDEQGRARLVCDGGERYFSSGPMRFVN